MHRSHQPAHAGRSPQAQLPNGIGPRCSATGPSTAAGRNNRAPTSRIVPSRTKPNVTRVGAHGADGERRRLFGRQAAGQGDRGDDRDEAAEEHHQAGGDVPVGACRRRRRRVVRRLVEAPGVAKALEARAVVGGGRAELVEDLARSRGRPGCSSPSCPNRWRRTGRSGSRIMSGWMSRASMASFISRASTFLPRYSGVRPTIRPARKTPTIR